MLRRLELIGFKSFAERTRFEFVAGITAIVGPNGSGKSNIVDAVRWILGEQSAKNLRGGEMTDVIFNGSSTRKSLGLAEVTMTFDNSRRILNHESDQVQITRRVYRDGEGEYLINSQASRLKDIKELFLGSGAGHGAYSVIEQGRVDALLAASTKERRLIFEEAAGISRFKAKKQESLRKLDNVDADLLRVHDILGVLDKQLKTLRQQASKAQKYQEYTKRLLTLRVALGAREVQTLTHQIGQEQDRVQKLREELTAANTETLAREATLRQLTEELHEVNRQWETTEAGLAHCRGELIRLESATQSDRAQADYFRTEILRIGQQTAEQRQRQLLMERHQIHLQESLAYADQRVETEQKRAESLASLLHETTEQIAVLTAKLQAFRDRQFEQITILTKRKSQLQSVRQQQQRLQQELSQKQTEATRSTQRHKHLANLLNELSESDADVRQRLMQTRGQLAEYQSARDSAMQELDRLQAQLEQVREQRSAARAREEVLTGLETSFEGVAAGVRFVLEKLRESGPFQEGILGLVADLLAVRRDIAGLVELALGETAQRFVLRNESYVSQLADHFSALPGRIGLIPYHSQIEYFQAVPPLVGEPLAQHVSSSNPALVSQLLQGVWLVADLRTAQQLRLQFPTFRWVTRQGELLEADGTLVVGPLEQRSGLISRKSELRELRAELNRLDSQVLHWEHDQQCWRQKLDSYELHIQRAEEEIATLNSEAGGVREQLVRQREVQKNLSESLSVLAQEIAWVQDQLRDLEGEASVLAEQVYADESAAVAVEAELQQTHQLLQNAETIRDQRATEHTSAQVTLSRVMEQRNSLRQQADETAKELIRTMQELNQQLSTQETYRHRQLESELTALRATATAATVYLRKQDAERELAEMRDQKLDLTARHQSSTTELKGIRERHSSQRDLLHSHDLVLHDLQSRREGLIVRFREEFNVDLASDSTRLDGDDVITLSRVDQSDFSHADVQDEIAELRQKMTRLGPVNLEALQELTEQEKRDQDLRSQLTDLSESRKKLQQIIDQINSDSRRLFSETIQQVREHFQELFRKLFAGGMADIVLEDPNDILECGIEITVRPPGKETQKISLLSGGERALTAVALLLAIFRSRPSPFCLLDEVDAAMDEANTQRLASLLQEFSDRSQFIIITHKKRTMAAADLLYGVTMQESGVSKLVAVRFEDWPEESASGSRQAA